MVESSTIDSCIAIFHDDSLTSQADAHCALNRLAMCIVDEDFEPFLNKLLDSTCHTTPLVLELILSSAECGQIFANWLLSHFPLYPKDFCSSSTASILARLSSSLLFECPFERDLREKLSIYLTRVKNAPHALKALSEAAFPNVSERHTVEDEIDLKYLVRKPQRQRKGAKGPAKFFNPVAEKALGFFNFSVPFDSQEAEGQITAILKDQQSVLKFYLESMQRHDIAAAILTACVHREVLDTNPNLNIIKEQTILSSNGLISTPAAFPMVLPMKAALYFESADGFGEWRILISTRADHDLRDARRKDSKFFKIIVKKIKELSNGHFSDDNQKRLNGQNTQIPIYEAKMTRDSRLVYHIDCLPEYDADVERQVVKIFGVYTHAQIDDRLWDSVGYHLGRKGKEYRRRCTFRNRPLNKGDNVFMPACFPPPDIVEEELGNVPELPCDNLEELHSLLVLEKFVAFSQALLNSIMADLDVAHVFNVSPQEKEIIEYPYSCYVLGRSGTGKTTTMLFKMLGIERAYVMRKDSMAKPRQIFVTQSRVLAGKVEEYFSKLLDSLLTAERTREELAQLVKSKRQQNEEEGLIDIDDDQTWRADLPSRFSQLQDEHFPLFLTFDRLTSLLEADLSQVSCDIDSTKDLFPKKFSRLITYAVFLEEYWPHFSQKLTKGLNPALVFSELMSVIQGSEEALCQDNRFLDQTTYQHLSHRTQYTFANRRGTIHSIFMLYLKQKRMVNEYDAADRTHRVINAIQDGGVPGQKIDYLYVDEAQDNLLIDALFLRSLVRNPHGLFWAGDTAQTISVGSSFRFNDLKAFLYRLETRREQTLHNSTTVTQEAPRTFQLAVNYRSHGGIVQCAHSVIELITEFWPYAIDVLSREKGVVDGSKPVFFSGWDSETVRYEQFLFGENGNPIEFGAQQCILVRDDAARDELRRQVGEIGLIMTLYESKGLEFDDVLLYKFFEDSTVDLTQWRVVLNSLQSAQALVPDVLAPRFDEVRHAGVCSELKFLYVAITRARKNLWIVDCSEKGEPMRTLWTSRNQIQNCTPGTDVPRLAVSSSPEEWEKSGKTLFQNKRYFQAMHCFERAGLNREVAVSRTYYLREQARLMPNHGSKQSLLLREKAFATAADAFLSCVVSATTVKEKKAYLRSAAGCFENALDDFKAAQAYSQAEEFTVAAKLYRKCAKFDEAVAIVIGHRPFVELEVAENIIDVARLFYFKNGELDKATQLFNSVEEELEYLEDFDLDISRAAVLEKLRKYEDAAEIHLLEGRTLEAIRLFLMDGSNQAAIQRGNGCILQGLWEHVSFGVKKFFKPEEVARLLALAAKIKSSDLLEAAAVDELTMFEAINAGDLKLLRTLSKKFVSRNDRVSAVLCLDHYFQSFPSLRNLTSLELSELLHDFHFYCRSLETLILARNPCNNILIRKLFRIHPSSDNIFLLPNATFLHSKIIATRVNLVRSDEEGILISEWELRRKFKECLMDRLLHIVQTENNSCRHDASAFTPCLPYIVNRQCNRVQCPRQHIEASSLTRSWYNLQVRIHLQQILIFQTLRTAPPLGIDKIRQFRYWIGRLYETLYPPLFHLGNVANLDIAALPEANIGFKVAKMWSLNLLYNPSHHRYDPKNLTVVCQTARFCFLVDKQKALGYVSNAPVINLFRTLPDFSRKSGDVLICIVPEIVDSLLRMERQSIPRGVLFVQQVVDKLLPIDINVLCDIIDYLCGAVILVLRDFILHNVTLPRSWFIALLPNFKNDPKSNIDIRTSVNALIKSLGQLLDRMYSGKDLHHLLYENSDLERLFIQRATFILRICRAMGLVGHNLFNNPLRDEILGFMKLLNGAAPNKPHHLYKEYAYAKTWARVAATIQGSTKGSPLDEMVQLYHESRKEAPPPPLDVHRVIFKNSAEVMGLLNNSKPAVISNLRPDAPVFVPKPRVDQGFEEIEGTEPEQEIEEPEVDNTDIIGAGTSVESSTVTALPEANLPPSEEQIHATRVIQTAYRKLLRRRHKSTKSTLEASRASFFDACLEESLKMEWPNGSYYRFLFLGPLPHVLVCLSAAHSWAIDTKARNKKRLRIASHQELEDVGKRLTEHTKVIKDLQRLQEALKPQSKLHRKREVETLKSLVVEVECFLDNIAHAAHTVTRDVKDDMAMAMKGIVAVRKPPKPKPKPTIKIDDDVGDLCDEFEHGMEDGDDMV
ncbi:hypothetical protein BYT27DRAFT_7189247 [Phlegmacium glaucopus]|nr:hypothetical protein BYT27DRAFT_7189247 [Phlegmacium glaucopus]